MSDVSAALAVVKLCLECRGYDACRAERAASNTYVQDGHGMLQSLEMLCKQGCDVSVLTALQRILQQMEHGYYFCGQALAPGESFWTRKETNYALRQGGFSEIHDGSSIVVTVA